MVRILLDSLGAARVCEHPTKDVLHRAKHPRERIDGVGVDRSGDGLRSTRPNSLPDGETERGAEPRADGGKHRSH